MSQDRPNRITIPATLEQVVTSLDGIGRLLTAKEWQRAAIVYAFTEPSEQRGAHLKSEMKLGFVAFANLGIAGLQSDNTVRAYRKAWQWAIDEGYTVAVKPGDEIELPTVEWTRSAFDLGYSEGVKKGWDEGVRRAKRAFDPPWRPPRSVGPPPDWDTRAQEAAELLQGCLNAISTNSWEPKAKTVRVLARAVALAGELGVLPADDRELEHQVSQLVGATAR